MIKTIFTLTIRLSMLMGLTACQKSDADHDPDKKVAPHALDKDS